MILLMLIRNAMLEAWLAGDNDAYLDWRDAELEELQRIASTV